MIEASNSLRPSRVNTEPMPALNSGLSSSATTARVTASRLVPRAFEHRKAGLERRGEAGAIFLLPLARSSRRAARYLRRRESLARTS